jgi:2-iminoacetate synthase
LFFTFRRLFLDIASGSSEWANRHATGQFDIADERTPHEVAELIRRLGYEPVWKDWDAALTP